MNIWPFAKPREDDPIDEMDRHLEEWGQHRRTLERGNGILRNVNEETRKDLSCLDKRARPEKSKNDD